MRVGGRRRCSGGAGPSSIDLTVVLPAFERIGHGGASALAPANTLASFDAAHDVGVDVVEFDVRAWHGELVLAHTVLHAARAAAT